MKRIAVFPGSFDPVTKGHESVVRRALPLFDEVIVAVGVNAGKNALFSAEKRMQMLSQVFRGEPKIRMDAYEGLTVDYCKKMNARYILRGMRTVADFEFESSIAQMNRALAPEIETVFMLTEPSLSMINASIVRDIYKNGGDVTPFLPEGLNLDLH